MKRKILKIVVIVLLLIQFIRIDKNNPPIDQNLDFITVNKPNENIENILKSACYDCHSNETKFPWYSNVAPFSLVLRSHVKGGRQELNFSEWGSYDAKKMTHKAEEAVEMLEIGRMPMKTYVFMHSEAKLSKEQVGELIGYFKGL